MILLIHPPVAKPSEPPAGIARLSGLLTGQGVEHRRWDANLEGLLYLLEQPRPQKGTDDTWTRRAFRNREANISALRTEGVYASTARYTRAVKDLGRVLSVASPPGVTIGLANYDDGGLSPLRSADLIRAAEQPELNPFFSFFSSRLREFFREKVPAFIGISLNYLSQAMTAFAMIGFIRRELPEAKIILGGGLVTSWLRNREWRNPFSGLGEYLVAGPGEGQLLSILGIEGGTEGLPRPDYNGLSSDSYLSPGFVLPYAASSGCYWNRCAFCPEEAEGNPYLPIPVPQALSDLTALTEETKPSLVHLLDNAISPALLTALTEKSIGAPWYGFARVGPQLAAPDFCHALKRSGCVMLKLGIESGDQGVLNALNKGTTVEMASRVLRNLRDAGIATYVYLLFGTPPETEAAARRTLGFTVSHSDCIGFLNLAIFNMPLCGSPASGIERRGFSDGDLSLYTGFSHPSGWERRRVRLFLEREFRTHRAVSPILRNDPPVFTSNHAPFLAMAGAGNLIRR